MVCVAAEPKVMFKVGKEKYFEILY